MNHSSTQQARDLSALGPYARIRRTSPVVAVGRIRSMSGGAQSQLLEGEDGHQYVVKSVWNPQSRRTLVNEWIGGGLFRYCGIATAPSAPVLVNGPVLAELVAVPEIASHWNLDTLIHLHHGSQLPVNPDAKALYDFLPEALLSTADNLDHFIGAMAVDCWIGNVDARQAVFFRGSVKHWARRMNTHRSKMGLIALMIDHGHAFNGRRWMLKDAQPPAPYRGGSVYQAVTGLASFSPWIEQINALSPTMVDDLRMSMPEEWEEGDENALDCLLEDLDRRKSAVPQLLDQVRQAYPAFFPNWR